MSTMVACATPLFGADRRAIMGWRLHLTNQAIQSLDILEGDVSLLSAWSRQDRVSFYDLTTGAILGEKTLSPPEVETRQDDAWQTFVGEFTAPNNMFLPLVRTEKVDIYTTDDGRMHLYHDRNANLFLESDGKEVKLDLKNVDTIRALALDRFLGLSVALDAQGLLHIFQQHIRVGTFNLNLNLGNNTRLAVAISRGGGAIYVSDGQAITLTDTGGQARKRIETHYFIGDMACSPDGKYLITNDIDTGVLRVYRGSDLSLLYQRFAIDLLADATQVQLIADLPPWQVALSALTISNTGVIAFAMSGVICVSGIQSMDNLPRPQKLL